MQLQLLLRLGHGTLYSVYGLYMPDDIIGLVYRNFVQCAYYYIWSCCVGAVTYVQVRFVLIPTAAAYGYYYEEAEGVSFSCRLQPPRAER